MAIDASREKQPSAQLRPVEYMKKSVRSALARAGIEVTRKRRRLFPVELTSAETGLFNHVRRNELSMVGDEGLFATIMACKHVAEENVEGDFVECGVWRGGNALLATGVFKLQNSTRKTYLFDTFGGMTEPSEFDTSAFEERAAIERFRDGQREDHNEWIYASEEEVSGNFREAGLLHENVVMIKGDVLATLEDERNLPERIAVLRLDTDFYESTKRELEILYPRLSIGGVLIIDDYGHWQGSRAAVDEYFRKHCNRPFLQYVDYTVRVGVRCR